MLVGAFVKFRVMVQVEHHAQLSGQGLPHRPIDSVEEAGVDAIRRGGLSVSRPADRQADRVKACGFDLCEVFSSA